MSSAHELLRREFAKCVDEALGRLLGEAAKKALLWHLERRFGVRLEKALERPSEFAEALATLLGVSAYRYIEAAIIKELWRRFPLAFDRSLPPTLPAIAQRVARMRA